MKVSRETFGWDLPPGVTDRMIDEAAGGYDEPIEREDIDMKPTQCPLAANGDECKGVEVPHYVEPTRLQMVVICSRQPCPAQRRRLEETAEEH